jgi:23S rRNA G2445 N2-methylase RlmL
MTCPAHSGMGKFCISTSANGRPTCHSRYIDGIPKLSAICPLPALVSQPMSFFTTVSSIFITCNKRLAPFLAKEVEALGYKSLSVQPTGVQLQGTMTDCIRLNLSLRCASQVMYALKKFICRGPDDLYRQVKKIDWENIIPQDGYLSIGSNVYHHTIRTDMFANVRVKDAIVDRIRDKTGKRPDTGPLLSGTVVYLFWKEEDAEIFIDTTGETLAKHGYRKIPGKAPMLEALAAATLLATQWDRKSPFVNPMCGSGTLAIEAALLATHRMPGLLRGQYAFQQVTGYEEEAFEKALEEVKAKVKEVAGLRIIATDISDDAVHIAKINATIAGVENYIEFNVCDYSETMVPQDVPGVVMFNPEYGERLGEVDALEETYAGIGDFMKKKCKGYSGYIFTGNLELAKKIGLKPRRRIEFYTGKIDCRLLEYELYAGTRRIDKQAEND